MKNRKISRQEAEQILTDRFYGKNVKFSYPGYKDVYGMMGTMAVERQEIIMLINGRKYTCSPEALNECLTLLTKDDGNHTGTDQGDAGRIQ